MILLLDKSNHFIWGMTCQLGAKRRNLNELKQEQLICNEVDDLARLGYEHNYGAAPDEDLFTLSKAPFSSLLAKAEKPQALVCHHSYGQNASLRPGPAAEPGFMPYAQYFPAELMRSVNADDIPFLGSFATGCTGFISLIMTAGGLSAFSSGAPVICMTADVKPDGSTYDAMRERILTTDCCSGFLMGKERCGYQVLGISFYSTKRPRILLIDIVKRTVNLIRDLAKALEIDLVQNEAVLHFPNAFPDAWEMVTNYLKIPGEPRPLDGLAERAHCLSSDPVITLSKTHRGTAGRLHIVANFGTGLHLGVCFLREQENPEPVR